MFSQTYVQSSEDQLKLSAFFTRVYGLMAGALALSAGVAWLTVSSPAMIEYLMAHTGVFYFAMIVELLLVIVLSAALHRLSTVVATIGFLIYAALTGFTLCTLFLVYTAASIVTTFVVTAGVFAAMAFYGLTTRRNLGAWGGFLFGSLIGMILASLINLFLHSPMIEWILSYAGVVVFSGLIAYDTQKLSAYCYASDSSGLGTLAIRGALNLYLDFINLFLSLIRVMGDRK